MKQIIRYLTILFTLHASHLPAQGYQALNGSPYAGSSAVFNNPAASVGSAYKWELSPFSLQLKISTNAAYLKNFSFANQDSAALKLTDGFNSHFMHATMDLSFLNFLYKIDTRRAVNFNLRARSYNHIKTQPVNIEDTISSFHSFLVANRNTPYLDGFLTHTAWLEADLNYSQVISENSTSKLSGGITLQIMKGLSGAYVKINKLSYLESRNATDTAYNFTNGGGGFGYSNNYDSSGGVKDFLKNTRNSLGLSLGIEYLIYDPELNSGTENNNLNYIWKIGVSIMDIGSNSYNASQNTTQFTNPISSISDATVDNKIRHTANFTNFVDSVKTLFNNHPTVNGHFTITNPTRLIINIDRNLTNHFYINGELSMNFYSTSSYTQLRTRELNLLTITPRWETIAWGVYLPVQYNTQGQLWIGTALKLGPLVIGVHNLGLFKKDPTLNGGGYLLLSIRPFNKRNVLSSLDCPE